MYGVGIPGSGLQLVSGFGVLGFMLTEITAKSPTRPDLGSLNRGRFEHCF